MIIPSTRKGMSLPVINTNFLIGETLICSMVPLSFSCTMLNAVCMDAMAVTRVTRMAGTIYRWKFIYGLNQLEEAMLICGASAPMDEPLVCQSMRISSLKSLTI